MAIGAIGLSAMLRSRCPASGEGLSCLVYTPHILPNRRLAVQHCQQRQLATPTTRGPRLLVRAAVKPPAGVTLPPVKPEVPPPRWDRRHRLQAWVLLPSNCCQCLHAAVVARSLVRDRPHSLSFTCSFGFVDNAERINSRAAMIGFFALLLVEVSVQESCMCLPSLAQCWFPFQCWMYTQQHSLPTGYSQPGHP